MLAINIIIILALLISQFMKREWLFFEWKRRRKKKNERKNGKTFIIWNEFYVVNNVWLYWIWIQCNEDRQTTKMKNVKWHYNMLAAGTYAKEVKNNDSIRSNATPPFHPSLPTPINVPHNNNNNNNENIICNVLLPSSKFSQLPFNRFESWIYLVYYCI